VSVSDLRASFNWWCGEEGRPDLAIPGWVSDEDVLRFIRPRLPDGHVVSRDTSGKLYVRGIRLVKGPGSG
jgi:hypothetical protein